MDELEGALVSVRADTRGFARDVAAMRGTLEDALGAGADRAGRAIEGALMRAVRTGKLGFEDLKRVALSVLAEIASAAVRDGIGAVLGGLGRGGASGLPGRATGGPVAPGRAYLVGERGPELFVPASSGRVVANAGTSGAREVRVSITVNAGGGVGAPQALERSSRQVARALRAALAGE